MAKVWTLQPEPALALDIEVGSTRLAAVDGLGLLSFALPLGADGAVNQRLQDLWGVRMPVPGSSRVAGDIRVLWMAPDQGMVVLPEAGMTEAMEGLQTVAYVTEQSDAWVTLELAGPLAVAAMERLCALDLETLAPGDCPRTPLGHLSAVVLRLGPDTFWLLGARSSALSLAEDVETVLRNVSLSGA